MWYKYDLGSGESIFIEGPDCGGPDDWFDKLLKWCAIIVIGSIMLLIIGLTFKQCSDGKYGKHVQVETIDGSKYYKYTGQGLKEGEMYIDERMEGHKYYRKFKK